MLCFSLLLFISNGVNAIENHSPPGISYQYDMPEGVSSEVFTIEKVNTIAPVINLVEVFKPEVKRGILCGLLFWPDGEKYIINNKIANPDNSLYVYNHLLYETSISNDCNQHVKPTNKHGVCGLETGYEQVSRLGLYV